MEPAREVPLDTVVIPDETKVNGVEAEHELATTIVQPESRFQPLCNQIRILPHARATDYHVRVRFDAGAWVKMLALSPERAHWMPGFFTSLQERSPSTWSASDFLRVTQAIPMIYPALDSFDSRRFADIMFGADIVTTQAGTFLSKDFPATDFSTGAKSQFLENVFDRWNALEAMMPVPLTVDEEAAYVGVAAWKPPRHALLDRDELRQMQWMLRTAHFYTVDQATEDTLKYNYWAGINNSAVRPYRSAAENARHKISAWSHGQPIPPLEVHRRRYIAEYWASDFMSRVSARIRFPPMMFRSRATLEVEATKTARQTGLAASMRASLQELSDAQARSFWARYIAIMTAGCNVRVRVAPETYDQAKYATAQMILDLLFPDFMRAAAPGFGAQLGAVLDQGRVNTARYRGLAVRPQLVNTVNGDPGYTALCGHAPGGPNYRAGAWNKLDEFVAIVTAARASQAPNHVYLVLLSRFFDHLSLYNMIYYCTHVANYVGYDFVLQPPNEAEEAAAGVPTSVEIFFSASELLSAVINLTPRPIFDAGITYEDDQAKAIVEYANRYEPFSGIPYEEAYEQLFFSSELVAAFQHCLGLFPIDDIRVEHLRVDLIRNALSELFVFNEAHLFEYYRNVRAVLALPASRFFQMHNQPAIGPPAPPAPRAVEFERWALIARRFVLVRAEHLELRAIPGYNNVYVITHVPGEDALAMEDVTHAKGASALSHLRSRLVNPKLVDEPVYVRPMHIRDNLDEDIDLWVQQCVPVVDNDQYTLGGIKRSGALKIFKLNSLPVVHVYATVARNVLLADLRARLGLEVLAVPHRNDAHKWRDIEYDTDRLEIGNLLSAEVPFI